MKTTARKEHAKHAVPAATIARMILEKLKDFDIDGLGHGYTMERAEACEMAEEHLKEALAALMMADGAYKANVMFELEEKLAEAMKPAPMFPR